LFVGFEVIMVETLSKATNFLTEAVTIILDGMIPTTPFAIPMCFSRRSISCSLARRLRILMTEMPLYS